jgi:hypothetical protein
MKRSFGGEGAGWRSFRSEAANRLRRRQRGDGRRRDYFARALGAFEQLEARRLLAVDAAAIQQEYGQLPVSFEVNQGQTDGQVKFLAHGAGYALYLTGSGATLDLRQSTSGGDGSAGQISGTVIDMQFVGANQGASVIGLDKQQTVSNYFVGGDPSQWQTGVANYRQVEYQNLYSGVSAVFYGNQGQLEYDFHIAPGADPNKIQLQIRGADGLSVDGSGNLLIHTSGGDLVEKAPALYQEVGGQRVSVSGHFVLIGSDRVGFAVGTYDASLPLVIDPTLSYSTYLGGGSFDEANGIAVDGSGNAYVTGVTFSPDFPTTAGAYQTAIEGFSDAFVTKFSVGGSSLIYSTYLGGNGNDQGVGIALDNAGNAYVTGNTDSTNFPTSPGAFQTAYAGSTDAFVAKLSASGGGLVYSTYLGGSALDEGNAIAVDSSGSVYVTGRTGSADFPTTAGAFQTILAGATDAFVAKLNPSGSALAYSTFLGGSLPDSAYGIAVDAAGNAYVTGQTTSADFPTTAGAFQTVLAGANNAFVAKLNATGSALAYSTYLGGSSIDQGSAIAVDGGGNAYVAGFTYSANFPTTMGAFQTTYSGAGAAFVTKVNAAGTGLVYSTYLTGDGADLASGLAIDAAGNAYVTGQTGSTNFPTTPDAFQTTLAGSQNAYLTKLNGAGTGLLYSTYLGGSVSDLGTGVAIDGAGGVYLTGYTFSPSFPVTAGAFQTAFGGVIDGFVAKFSSVPPTTPVDSDPGPNRIAEQAPTGTYVGLTAYSTDPEGGSIVYSLTSDSSGGGFQIDPVTGRVTVADGNKILYNANPSHTYQVTVRATAADGLTASQTFTIAVTTHDQAFINQLYIDLLNRPADPNGMAYWDSQLSAGVTRTQVALGIEQTLEYAQDTVESLYTRYLHRAANSSGLSYFSQLLLQGVTVEQISAMLAGSAEFYVVQGGGTNGGFLNALYQDALGRPVDPNGLAWWSIQLAAGVSRTTVALEVLSTTEYLQDVVEAAYQQFLGRAAGSAGLSYWVGQMQLGATDQQLNASLAGSEEYYARSE